MVACSLAFHLFTNRVSAELVVTEEFIRGEGQLTTFKMTVSPAAEPVPALKHRLVARELDLKQGNAVPFYYRALFNIGQQFKAVRKKFKDYDRWYSQETALDQVPVEQAREAANSWLDQIQELRRATLRRNCDWGWNVEEQRGPEIIAYLLPEIQESRELARALSLRIRLAIIDRNYSQALDELRMCYRLGHDIAEAPFLVSDLVGIAICGVANSKVIELIAQPDSPNLYWAIAELPDPIVSVQESMQSEMSIGLRVFPFILDAETAEHSPGEWARLMAEAIIESQKLVSSGVGQNVVPESMTARFAVTAMSMVAYPAAKQRLMDQGMTAEEVEAMPVGKVVSIDALREYRRIADSIEKWSYVPYREVRDRDIDEALRNTPGQNLYNGFGYTLARLLLPAVQVARKAEQRLVWQTRGIQTVEAIRMHAAETGKLPESLEEIEIVPLPRNPITDKPYAYELEGDTSIVKLPFEDGFSSVAWRFEITLAK